jgi:Sec-independent protein translocase protein TatA
MFQRSAGDAQREFKDAWGSDEEEEADDGSDDSDGDNTII